MKKLSETFSKSLIDDVQRWGCMKSTLGSGQPRIHDGVRLLAQVRDTHCCLPCSCARSCPSESNGRRSSSSACLMGYWKIPGT
ncbi:hypothetical protein MLD38_038739 [Melastoma candidum]|uniref:Uncharacterized protein n=1 Tax=Melastoma candidum TaxID=119954 RepID=A0ACB9L070_9MYRT|nr:hypothetical protein MLD38_038739 [Melastoma candidum]